MITLFKTDKTGERWYLPPLLVMTFICTMVLAAEETTVQTPVESKVAEIKQLFSRLGHDDFKIRKRATEELIAIAVEMDQDGKRPYGKLVSAEAQIFLKSSDPEVVLRVRKVLTYTGEVLKPAKEVRASHIYFDTRNVDEATRKAKLANAKAVREKLLAGADFSAMAKAHSECPSKSKGGDLGRFGVGKMTKSFETAALTQAVGAVGPIVTTTFGYHIIMVTKRYE